MIVGLGTDIIAVSRIGEAYDQFEMKFVNRILNEIEQPLFAEKEEPIRYLAKQYAIKEAAAKALGTGMRQGIGWHDIYIEHDKLGAPILKFRGNAEKQFKLIAGVHSWVTLSDEKDYVVATIILEK